jgi:hypothetical protein
MSQDFAEQFLESVEMANSCWLQEYSVTSGEFHEVTRAEHRMEPVLWQVSDWQLLNWQSTLPRPQD